jgi:hypothetical protein
VGEGSGCSLFEYRIAPADTHMVSSGALHVGANALCGLWGLSHPRRRSSVDVAPPGQRQQHHERSKRRGAAVFCGYQRDGGSLCDVPFGCAGSLRVSGAVRDVLLAWRCALMVRPGGGVGQLVSNVGDSAPAVPIQGVRCCTGAVGSGGPGARRAVENAAATGEVVGAAGGSGRGASNSGAAIALGGVSEVECSSREVSRMRVWVWAGGQDAG